MALAEVAVLYVACGVGCAVTVLAKTPKRFGDALIVLPLWPLLAPFLFLRNDGAANAPIIDTLLPTAQAVEPLRRRLALAQTRLREIDVLLLKPTFDLENLEARITSLEQTEASPLAVASATSRRKSVLRLVRRRKSLASELEELSELFLQLETQTEVVRLAGTSGDSVGDLIADIQSRLETIDELEAEASVLE